MKILPTCIWMLVATFLVEGVSAQTLVRPDGRRVPLESVKVIGATIVFFPLPGEVDFTHGEMPLPIENLRSVEWPVPPEVIDAEADLAAGRFADAMRKTAGPFADQLLFRNVPGSTWARIASVRVIALAGAGYLDQAQTQMAVLRATRGGGTWAAKAELSVLERLAADGDATKLRAGIDSVRAMLVDRASRARLALLDGGLLLKEGKAEEALFAYLYVPVFFSGDAVLVPQSMQGAANAFRAMGDDAAAAAMQRDLQQKYPQFSAAKPEAAPEVKFQPVR